MEDSEEVEPGAWGTCGRWVGAVVGETAIDWYGLEDASLGSTEGEVYGTIFTVVFLYTMTDDDSGGHFLLFLLVSIFTLYLRISGLFYSKARPLPNFRGLKIPLPDFLITCLYHSLLRIPIIPPTRTSCPSTPAFLRTVIVSRTTLSLTPLTSFANFTVFNYSVASSAE